MDGTNPIQIIAVNILRIRLAHDIDEHIGGDVFKVGKHERIPVAVLVSVRKKIERYESNRRLLADGRVRKVGRLSNEIQIHLKLAIAQDKYIARILADNVFIGHQLIRQRIASQVGLRSPTIYFVKFYGNARFRLVKLKVTLIWRTIEK